MPITLLEKLVPIIFNAPQETSDKEQQFISTVTKSDKGLIDVVDRLKSQIKDQYPNGEIPDKFKFLFKEHSLTFALSCKSDDPEIKKHHKDKSLILQPDDQIMVTDTGLVLLRYNKKEKITKPYPIYSKGTVVVQAAPPTEPRHLAPSPNAKAAAPLIAPSTIGPNQAEAKKLLDSIRFSKIENLAGKSNEDLYKLMAQVKEHVDAGNLTEEEVRKALFDAGDSHHIYCSDSFFNKTYGGTDKEFRDKFSEKRYHMLSAYLQSFHPKLDYKERSGGVFKGADLDSIRNKKPSDRWSDSHKEAVDVYPDESTLTTESKKVRMDGKNLEINVVTKGPELRAIQAGIVIAAPTSPFNYETQKGGLSAKGGNALLIMSPNIDQNGHCIGFTVSYYAHLSDYKKADGTQLKVGDVVKSGDQIGHVGNTGVDAMQRDVHVHIERRKVGKTNGTFTHVHTYKDALAAELMQCIIDERKKTNPNSRVELEAPKEKPPLRTALLDGSCTELN